MASMNRTLIPKESRKVVARGSNNCLHITALVCGFATRNLRINPLIIAPKEIPGDLPPEVIRVNDWAANGSGWITADKLA